MGKSRLEVWELLISEAHDRQICVACGAPLKRGPGRLRVKCDRPECLRYYNSMYRRLRRPREK